MEVERGIGVSDASHNMLPCPVHGERGGDRRRRQREVGRRSPGVSRRMTCGRSGGARNGHAITIADRAAIF